MVKKKVVDEQETSMSENTPSDEPKGLLTEDERRDILEQLTPDRLELAAAFAEVLHQQESRERVAADLDRYEQKRQRKLKTAAAIAESDVLDDVERMSLHIIGNLAMNWCLPREQIHDDGGNSFYYLFKTIDRAVREALMTVDTDELECIGEAEKDRREKMAAFADAATASLSDQQVQYVKGTDDDEETA